VLKDKYGDELTEMNYNLAIEPKPTVLDKQKPELSKA